MPRQPRLPPDSSLSESAAKNIAWSAVGRWTSKFLALASFAFLARTVGPTEFGKVALSIAIVEILRQIGQQGLMQSIVRHPNLTDETLQTAIWLNAVGNSILAGLLFVLAPNISVILDIEQLAPILRCLCLYLIIVGFTAVPEALLQRDLRFDALASRTILASLLGAVIAVSLAGAGAGVWALVGQYMTQGVCSLVLVWKSSKLKLRFKFTPREAKQLLRFGWKVLTIDVITVANLYGDTFVILLLFDETALGLYSIAYRLIYTLIDMGAGSFSPVALPLLSRMSGDPGRLIAALTRMTKTALAVGAPMFLIVAFSAPQLIRAAFGDSWIDAAPLLSALAVGALFSVATFADRAALLSANRPGLELVIVTGGAIATVSLAAIGAQFGLLGAAIGVAIKMALVPVLRIMALRSVLPLRPLAHLRAMRSVLVACLVGATAMAVASNYFSTALAIPVTALIYAGCLYALDRQFVMANLRLARRLARRTSRL